MDSRILGLHHKSKTVQVPLLMERAESHGNNEHVIDITGGYDASSSSSFRERLTSGLEDQNGGSQYRPSTSSRTPVYQQPPLSSGSSSSNSSSPRRGNSRGHPLNSILWISVELILTSCQIIAALIILYLSRNEKPRAPLRTWILGYVSGCCGIIPLLYWRFKHRNISYEQDPSRIRADYSQVNSNTEPMSMIAVDGEHLPASRTTARGTEVAGLPNPMLKAFVEYLKIALDCFFAVWFVVGNVWVFGGHSSSAEAPYLYRLCIVFIALSSVGYAIPFILCIAICCCLPCLISVIGFTEDYPHYRGATQETINSLPTHKFKEKKSKSGRLDKESSAGGVVAAGTEKEHHISPEDAVCCICLSKYSNNDELRELSCSHFFHRDCVDKWLKMNASCPLCKAEVVPATAHGTGF